MKLLPTHQWHEDLGASIFVSFSRDENGNILGEPPELMYSSYYLEENFDQEKWTHFIDGDFNFIFSDADPANFPLLEKALEVPTNSIPEHVYVRYVDTGKAIYLDKKSAKNFDENLPFDFHSRPEDVPVDGVDRGAKYRRVFRDRNTGEEIEGDVYDVLEAFEVNCSARAHAIKKLLLPGSRGAKGYNKDCDEAINSIEESKKLERFRTNKP